MTNSRTTAATRAAAGKAFADTRTRIWNEIVSLHDAWAQYRYLFNESNERVQLLNTCASWFFATTQRLLMREVILGISRLTDPVKFGRFDNLVLSSLLLSPARFLANRDG